MPQPFDRQTVLGTAMRLRVLSEDLLLLAEGLAPSSTDLDAAPYIEGWSIVPRAELALQGTVEGHPLIAAGPVLTSGLYVLDREAGFARTLSRFYRLGREASR